MRRLLCILFILNHYGVFAQEGGKIPDKDSSFILLDADLMRYSNIQGVEYDTLVGNVQMRQDSLLMICDYATVINQKFAQARGNIIIVHKDSVQIYGDSLSYNGESKVAQIFGEVIFQDGQRRFYTRSLSYNVKDQVADYFEGGTLIENTKKLVSKEASYDSKEKLAIFRRNVVFEDSGKKMIADSLKYFSDTEQLEFISPTRIEMDSTSIYCEEGIYRSKTDEAVLSGNVQIKTKGKDISAGLVHYRGGDKSYILYLNPQIRDSVSIALADTIFYSDQSEIAELKGNASYTKSDQQFDAPEIWYDIKNDLYKTSGRSVVRDLNSEMEADHIEKMESGMTIAAGEVKFVDFEEKMELSGGMAEIIEESEYFKTYNKDAQVLMKYWMGEDTLFLRADTLTKWKDTISGVNLYNAYYDVRIFRKDFAAVADSFRFNPADSIIQLSGEPILWKDSTQMSADTAFLWMSGNTLRQIDLLKNAMIVSKDSLIYYNQIKGREIKTHLSQQLLKQTEVSGNGELIFYVKSSSGYKGINQSKCNKMSFDFDENGEIQLARLYGDPESEFFEYNQELDFNSFRLEGFFWETSKRPLYYLFQNITDLR